MLSKHFLLAFVYNILIPQIASGATLEEAQKALTDYYHAFNTNNVTQALFDEDDAFHRQLNVENSAAEAEISDQKTKIFEQISTFVANSKKSGIAVDECIGMAKSDLENFTEDLRNRLGMCYGTVVSSFNGLVASAYNRLWNKLANEYYCGNMSIVECSKQTNQSECYDFVIDNLKKATERIPNTLNVIWADILNTGPGVHIYCRQMVVQEMELYPTLVMDFVSSCVNTKTVEALNYSC